MTGWMDGYDRDVFQDVNIASISAGKISGFIYTE